MTRDPISDAMQEQEYIKKWKCLEEHNKRTDEMLERSLDALRAFIYGILFSSFIWVFVCGAILIWRLA